jgi:hypothetical protein
MTGKFFHRRRLSAILFASAICLLTVAAAQAVTYNNTQIRSSGDNPFINSQDAVAWQGSWSDPGVFLYDAGNTTQISSQGGYNRFNDQNQFVYIGKDNSGLYSDLFFYDNGTTTRITNDSFGEFDAQINNQGAVVWCSEPYMGASRSLWYWQGGSSKIIDSQHDTRYPQLNNNGKIVWMAYDGSDYEICLYDGTTTTWLTNNSGNDWMPQINDAGQVVWWGSDGHDLEIYLYDPGTKQTTQITNNDYSDAYQQINNKGQVAYLGYAAGNDTGDIFLWEMVNGQPKTTRITNNTCYDGNLRLNDSGEVVWDSGSSTYAADCEIYVYAKGSTSRVTNNGYADNSPDINNAGNIVWTGDNGIYLGVPASSEPSIYAGLYTLANNNTYLCILYMTDDLTYYQGFNTQNSQQSFYGFSKITAQHQNNGNYSEDYFYYFAFSTGQAYLGAGTSGADSGTFFTLNFANSQLLCYGNYTKTGQTAQGNYYQYTYVFPSGATYVGVGVQPPTAGVFFTYPLSNLQTHTQCQYFRHQGESPLSFGYYWSFISATVLLDENF